MSLPALPSIRSLFAALRPRQRRALWSVSAAFLFFVLGWLAAPVVWPSGPAAADRALALRFADDAARHAHLQNLREAYLSAAFARHTDPWLPGMELLVGQMLFNAGHPQAAADYARTARRQGELSSSSAILLGLEAWSRRGRHPVAFASADLFSKLWLERAVADHPNDGAPRFFLAELERRAGRPDPPAMARALHRFQPWESSAILDAKMHLAAAEAGGSYNAAHLGRGLRLEASPQARAVKDFRRLALVEGADRDAARRILSGAFTARQVLMLGGDPALPGAADSSAHLTLLKPEPPGFLRE